MLECYEPSAQKQFESLLSLVGTDVDLSSLGVGIPEYLIQDENSNIEYKIGETTKKDIHYVISIIPTLKWRGGLLGVRFLFQPANIETLFND